MVQKYIVALVVLLVLALATPAFAGDLVNPKLLPPQYTYRGQLASGMEFAPQQAGQPLAAPPQPATTGRHWTKAGKILTFAGLGCAIAGGIMMTKQNQTIATTSTESVQIDWKATGAGFLGTGAVLAIVGLTRHSND
jgi:hypothetical protein